jgi:hypothetical protein
MLNRREWIAAAGAMALAARSSLATDKPRLKVAAVVTEFTYRSHAHVILENFLEPYYFNGELTDSGMDLVSLYCDQTPAGRDMSRDAAQTYGFTIYPTIAEALRCGGTKLAVDGVLSIGEHGNYPDNDRGQKLYPRKRFFDEIVQVFRADGRVVPLFNDKHLSFRWDWAQEMVETAHELEIPFMAGSSVPLAQRIPPLELPAGSVIEEALSLHSGPLEVYDFHALEVLQSLVESRRGSETGVEQIEFLEGDAVWQAAAEGRWSRSLADAALQAGSAEKPGRLEEFVEPQDGKRHPTHAVLITYGAGLKATILRIGKDPTRWKFDCRIASERNRERELLATSFYVGPWENRNLFKALAHAIQTHIREKRAPYPVERTLLTTGMLAAAMDSRFEKQPQPTPHLKFAYQPRDFRALREMGASWKIITEDQPQPKGIDPGGPRPKKS